MVFWGVVLLFVMTVYNLKSNSVYYARQMLHKEGTELDLVMLIKNMSWLYTPEIEGLHMMTMYGSEEGKTKQDLRYMLKSVLDAQTKSLVNLQWLFNILYQDRFD